MTTKLQSAISAQLGWTWRDRVGRAPIVDSNRLLFSKSLADGSGTDQSDAVWHAEERTLAAGESSALTLDMLQQTLFGDTITIELSRVKAILIVNRNDDGDGCLLVGGSVDDEWHAPFGSPGDSVRVMPDSPLLLANNRAGWEVKFGNSVLNLTAVGDDVKFDIAVLGVLGGSSSSSSSSST